jgi:hypothetical protein
LVVDVLADGCCGGCTSDRKSSTSALCSGVPDACDEPVDELDGESRASISSLVSPEVVDSTAVELVTDTIEESRLRGRTGD